ncbi:MAG: hypothetical protein HQ530_02840 [Parcubacteria group bacterium]|nr:hypothetical protein [Parcubacteria group bacterium]
MKAKTFRSLDNVALFICGLICFGIFIYELTKIILPAHYVITPIFSGLLIMAYHRRFRHQAWFIGVVGIASVLLSLLYLYWNVSTEEIFLNAPHLADREKVHSAFALSLTVPIFLGVTGPLFLYAALLNLFGSKKAAPKKKHRR